MGSPGPREAILAAQNNIEQHLQYCKEYKSSQPGAIPSTSPTWTHEIDNGNHTDLIVQFHDRYEFRGAVNSMMHLIHAHGTEKLQRVGIIGQGSVAHMREMTIAAGVYDIPVHSENTSTGSLDDLDPTSPLDLRRLEIDAQLDSVHEDPLQDKPIPFPSNEEINAVHGQGTVAFELEAELKTRDSQHMNKSRPDIIVSDLDGGIALSGICMAVAGTGTHVFGAAPQAGFWEHAWKSHTPRATPTPTEDDQAYRYWVDHTYPMSTIPWSTFTTPGHLSGIFEVNHEQVNAARILARDNYHLQLQSDEAVPLAVALYNEEFQTFASKGSKKGRKRVVGIILRSRKEYH